LRREEQTIHGKSYTTEYVIWENMNQRCLNPKHTAFHDYGGRGIKICKRWRSFANFWTDMGPRPSPSHQLDRRDNMKGYSKGNCRWVTKSVQQNNMRSNRWLELHGETLTMAQWAVRLGLRPELISNRLRAGWSTEKALSLLKYRNNGKPYKPLRT
jgi:hypothetical protein